MLLGNLGCLAAMAQTTNVYSLNPVGYINLPCPAGFSLISFPLQQTTNNDPADLLANNSGEFDGWQILIWTNNSYARYIGDHTAVTNAVHGWLEPNGPISMNPGVGAVIYNSGLNTYTITCVGTIPQGHLTQTLNPGLNLVGFFVPKSGGLSSGLGFPSVSDGHLDGDQAFLYYSSATGNGYTTFTVDSLSYNAPTNYGWDGPMGQGEPWIGAGQAFWYRAANQPIQWTVDFEVNNARPSPKLTERRAGASAGMGRPLMAGGRFQTRIHGQGGKSYVVERSPDLESWKPVATNRLSSATWFYQDAEPATNASRFYRALEAP
jgi:hypothetical protein